ncbi:uncharacterized protein TNCV_4163931 [Trichonephila clavipes]|nr:uncharacterized protein TNCV_4163931 [Trichonephila clavipes]
MENTHRRPSGKRPKKRRFRGNQFMKVCSHTHVAERKDTRDGDTKTFNALSENKPYGDDHLIQKIELGHVQKRMGTRLRKLKLVYSKKKLSDGKTIGGKGSTDDEPMHWFCPTNPNTWCKYNAAINNNLQNYKHKPSVAKAVRDVNLQTYLIRHPEEMFEIAEIAANLATSVFNDGNQILISILEKFGLKINRNVCVSLAERDNRRIFTSRQRCLQSSFEARRAKKIKKSKEIELFQEQEVPSRHAGTINSRQATSPLLRLVAGDERREAPDPPPECSPSKLKCSRAKSYCHLFGAQG